MRFSAVYGVGGPRSLPLFTPETGGGSRAKNRSFKRCCEIYRRVHWNNRGKKSIVWRCASRLEEKGSDCGSPTVSEEDLQKAVLRAINSIIAGRDEFIETLRRNIETALGGEFDESTEDIDRKLEELQHELLRLASTKAAYDSVANEIYRLRELRQATLASNAERQNRRQRITNMMEFLQGQSVSSPSSMKSWSDGWWIKLRCMRIRLLLNLNRVAASR